jgi:DNA-binding NtrC family response regulator
MKQRILLVDDEEDLLDTCRQVLERAGFMVDPVTDSPRAVRRLEEEAYDLVVTDLKLPELDGIGLLTRSRDLQPDTPVLLMTAFPTVETAVEAVKKGAFDYLVKPFGPDQLVVVVKRALNQRVLVRENRFLKQAMGCGRSTDVVGTSPAIARLLAQIDGLAPTDATVLILGETGTGKELLARRIHTRSHRAEGPFVAINCAAVPPDLLEAELFGVERGAFTDARVTRPGLLECAGEGSLFLDEVADLPLALQAKLLRVLEERAVRHLGSTREIGVDFRLLAATNRDVDRLVRERTFREDLFYRLNVVRLVIPPLRDRREDIGALADLYLKLHSRRYHRSASGLEAEAMDRLQAYDWPGNVRELSNVLERAVLLCSSEVVTVLDLPEEIFSGRSGSVESPARSFAQAKRQAVDRFEQAFVEESLRATGGNVTQAAARSDVGRSAFQRLMKRHGIRSEDHRT